MAWPSSRAGQSGHKNRVQSIISQYVHDSSIRAEMIPCACLPRTPIPVNSVPYPTAGISAIAVALCYRHTCAVVTGGVVKCWGYNVEGQLGIGSSENQASPRTVDLGSGVCCSTCEESQYILHHSCAQSDSVLEISRRPKVIVCFVSRHYSQY